MKDPEIPEVVRRLQRRQLTTGALILAGIALIVVAALMWAIELGLVVAGLALLWISGLGPRSGRVRRGNE